MRTGSSAWRVPLSALLVVAGLVAISALAFVVARTATSAATFTCEENAGPGALPLTGVRVFDGPPEQGIVITPQSANAAGTVVQWLFSGSSGRGTFLSCDYGGGVLRAIREVAPETTTCEAQLPRAEDRRISGARFHCR